MNNAKLQFLKDIHAALGKYIQSFGEISIPKGVKVELPTEVDQKETPLEETQEKEIPVEKPTEPETPVNKGGKGERNYTRKELEDMGYNDLKTLAKNLGLVAKGNRTEIIDLILKSENVSEEAETTDAEIDEPVVDEVKDENIEEADGEDINTDEEDIEAQVIEATEEMSDGELLNFLISYGIKAKGKRQALIAAAVKGVRDGIIALEDDGEEEAENDGENDVADTPEDSADEEADFGEEAEELDYDKINDPNNEEVTAERAASIEALTSDIDVQYKKGDLKRADLVEFIKDYFGDKDQRKHMTENDLVKLYKNLACLFINDEGEMPEDEAEPEVYAVNGDAYCCGHPCKWDEDAGNYICETCGGEYKADEE